MDEEVEKRRAARASVTARLLYRPSKKLEHGDQLIFHHALRCLCNKCGRLLTWEGAESHAQVEAICCSTRHVLQPRTVTVHVTDIKDDALLPLMRGSSFVDPNMKLDKYIRGEDTEPETKKSKGFSANQKELTNRRGAMQQINPSSICLKPKPKHETVRIEPPPPVRRGYTQPAKSIQQQGRAIPSGVNSVSIPESKTISTSSNLPPQTEAIETDQIATD